MSFKELLEQPIRSWPRERFSIFKGDSRLEIDLGRVETTSISGVSRFRAEISVSSQKLEVFRKILNQSTELASKLGRIRGGTSGLLGFGEVSILASEISEEKFKEISDYCEPEHRVRARMRAFMVSLEKPTIFLRDLLDRRTVFSYIAITDHWLTVFWASMRCGKDPNSVRDEYLSVFSAHLNANAVRGLGDDDLQKLMHAASK